MWFLDWHILEYSFWTGSQTPKSLHHDKTRTNSMKPIAKITICKSEMIG